MENAHLSPDADGLLDALNVLLDNLDIPIELESPYDLTPGLLLMVLESTLQNRLPLSDELRQARSPQMKVEAVKIFLGVLGNDILQVDLSDIDPRRLAQGKWEEVIHVGTLLVRVAKRVGALQSDHCKVVDLDPNATLSQAVEDDSFQILTTNSAFSVSKSPSPQRTPKAQISTSKQWPSSLASSSPRPSTRKSVSRSRGPKLPEKESTPPSKPTKPSFMTFQPATSPLRGSDSFYSNYADQTCSCTSDADMTSSTAHCHCETHELRLGSSIDSSHETSSDTWSTTSHLRHDTFDGKPDYIHSRDGHYGLRPF